MNSIRCLLALTFLALGFTVPAQAEENWSEARSKNGVDVQTRPVAGSGIKEFRGVTEIAASIDTLLDIMSDPSTCTQWVHNCTEARTVETVSKFERYTYQVTKMPWPVKDRDIVLHSVTHQDDATGVTRIEITAAPDKVKPTRNVRIQKSNGTYLLEPLDDGKRARVTWTMHSEPAGKLPEWLVNSLVIDLPVNSLSGLRKLAEARAGGE